MNPLADQPRLVGGIPLVTTVPHRFFFLAGVVQLVLASLWWAWVLWSRAAPAIPAPRAAMSPTVLHALLMVTGFAPLFMFGFLFTAGPRWLGLPAPPARAWLPPGLLAVTGALALVPLQLAGDSVGPLMLRVAAGMYAAGWLALVLKFAGLVRASPAPDKVHARLVLAALLVGAGVVGAFALAGPGAYAWIRSAGVWGFLLPVFVIVCHRMIPFFTSSALPFVTAFRPWWLLAAMLGASVAHGALDAAGLFPWTWVVDLPAAALMFAVTLRWGLVQSLANRLLAMLHLGFIWYAIGFLLAGIASLGVFAGNPVLGLAPLHAMTIGFAASLLMAMVTRVTCGHSGRTLAADALTWRLFQLLQLAAVARIAVDLVPSPAIAAVTVLLWASAFVPWCIKYAPVYWQPRNDGRPG